MNKKEIEAAIYNEAKAFVDKIGKIPGDKGLALLQQEAWRIADKYDTDGANVINILMTYMYKEKEK